jgi:acylphosphatase
MERRRVVVRGLVQGVYFRASVRDRARSLGVAGWVRNLPDGAVEAVFEGPPEAVESMVEYCRRGPGSAVVQEIEVVPEQPEGLAGFRVR